jgi:hypothetical protein
VKIKFLFAIYLVCLYIDGFYSKASDPKAGASIEEESEEILLRGAGRRLLCLVLDTLQWTHDVTLHASGLSYRDQVSLGARVKDMQVGAIMANLEEEILEDLKVLNPNMFEQWTQKRRFKRMHKHVRKIPSTLEEKENEEDLAALRSEWVRIRGNQNLVAYYMRTFGFTPLVFESFVSVRMGAAAEVIHQHCDANAGKDGDWNEVIVHRDEVDATSQVQKLLNCKTIRMMFLHDVQALPIVESLLPVTKCLGLLGSTSMFHLRAIEELLIARAPLTMQIDCLCLDSSNWSSIALSVEKEAWSRLYIRSVLVLSFARTDAMYDKVMNALQAKTGAIYHKVTGLLPDYLGSKRVDRAVRVEGEAMTDVGSRLYDDAGIKIER